MYQRQWWSQQQRLRTHLRRLSNAMSVDTTGVQFSQQQEVLVEGRLTAGPLHFSHQLQEQ